MIAASADHSKSVVTQVTRIVNEAKSEILSASRKTAVKRPNQKLVGKKVVAASPDGPDHEMGEEIYEISHAEQQTFADGQKHTVCLIKGPESKPTLSRPLSKLSICDEFVAKGGRPVRVLVISKPTENVLYHTGWRGVVETASSPNVKVNFPFLKMGKIAHTTVSVPRQHCRNFKLWEAHKHTKEQ